MNLGHFNILMFLHKPGVLRILAATELAYVKGMVKASHEKK